jgi:hypothetical protein
MKERKGERREEAIDYSVRLGGEYNGRVRGGVRGGVGAREEGRGLSCVVCIPFLVPVCTGFGMIC